MMREEMLHAGKTSVHINEALKPSAHSWERAACSEQKLLELIKTKLWSIHFIILTTTMFTQAFLCSKHDTDRNSTKMTRCMFGQLASWCYFRPGTPCSCAPLLPVVTSAINMKGLVSKITKIIINKVKGLKRHWNHGSNNYRWRKSYGS